MAAGALDLESSLKKLPGVLGCVILTQPDGRAVEVQAFTRAGVDPGLVHGLIQEEVARRDEASVEHIFVFELDAEAHFGDRESLERAVELARQEATARGPLAGARPGRPGAAVEPLGERVPVTRVILSSSAHSSHAEVALGRRDGEAVGRAEGDKTQHGLSVLVEATLEAAREVAGGPVFGFRGTSLVNAFGREAVLVVVEAPGGLECLGAALVRDGPVSEAAARATLDAINRQLPRAQ